MAQNVYPRVLDVEELTYYLKEYLAEDQFLTSVAVRGQVAGFKAHGSGHIFFTLRGGTSSLRVVMFRRHALELAWAPRDGDRLVAVGAVALYERDSVCQLYAETLLPDGAGEQALNLARLKERLQEEGLFAPERKQPLPHFAASLGVITAADSAAWADISRIALSRSPGLRLRLYPALVQGPNAPESLARAIAMADAGGHDVLICGRGGGAEEDLAAFNSELVVRAIANARTPLISAVGHESDLSLADLAADLRAATPTHAAALAAPDAAGLLADLGELEQRLNQALRQRLSWERERLERLAAAPALTRPETLLLPGRQRLEQAEGRLRELAAGHLQEYRQALDNLALLWNTLGPRLTLERGYAIVSGSDGQPLRQAAGLRAGDQVRVRLARGGFVAQVMAVEADHGDAAIEDAMPEDAGKGGNNG